MQNNYYKLQKNIGEFNEKYKKLVDEKETIEHTATPVISEHMGTKE